MKTKFTFIFIVAFCLTILPLSAAKYYLYSGSVNPWDNKTDGTNTQVTNLTTTLNSYTASDIVWIAAGTYTTNGAIVLKANMEVYGGFVGNENNITDRTFSDIDGNGVIEPWEFTNATIINGSGTTSVTYAVFNPGSAVFILNGVTIDGHTTSNANGGAIYTNANSTITNCIVRNINQTGANGAGIYSNAYGGATITGCLIENCVSATTGGAIYSNRKVTVKQCVLRNNKSTKGGAIFLSTTADASNTNYIINNTIYNNTATSQGGAIYINGAAADPVIIINNTVVNNAAIGGTVSTGGIIGIQATSKVYNNVVFNNYEGSDLSSLTIKNLRTTLTTGTVDLQYCAYDGGTQTSGASFAVTGNITNLSTPAFVQPSTTIGYTATMPDDVKTANFNIQGTSSLFDAGSSSLSNVPAIDLMGISRPQRTTSDIGAYEFYTTATITTPTITWSQDLSALKYGDSPVLTATSSATTNAAPITYTSDNTAVATVTNNTLSVVGIGSATITAHQAANGYYYAASNVSQSATTSQKELTITGISADNKVYDGTNTATLSGTPAYYGLVNGETFDVTGTPVAIFADVNVGTGISVIVTGYTAPSANYFVTQPTLTADITSAGGTTAIDMVNNASVFKVTKNAIVSKVDGFIEVIAFNGVRVKNEKVSIGQETSLVSGVYIVRLTTNKSTIIEKIVL